MSRGADNMLFACERSHAIRLRNGPRLQADRRPVQMRPASASVSTQDYFRWQIETFFKLLKGVGHAREMGGSGREAPFF